MSQGGRTVEYVYSFTGLSTRLFSTPIYAIHSFAIRHGPCYKLTMSTHWRTNRKYGYARRDDAGLTVIEHRGMMFLLSENIVPLKATDFHQAVIEADALHQPEGWRCVFGTWVSEHWQVKPTKASDEKQGWLIYSREGEEKSKQVFERPDLARKWCEVRKDRVGINLRGPKPKQRSEDEQGPEEGGEEAG